ncbi:MAG TPA: hypothetical protein VG273_27090 [Bryobacteraceae bacterium]|jgi:hypothetical protein|nr:hypothetical protein [Bryobacteraceae bacterium]
MKDLGVQFRYSGDVFESASDLFRIFDESLINKGFIEVSDKPGLGVTLNEDVVRRHLAPNTGYFEPTPQWDHERSSDWLWSMIQHEESRHF